MEMVSKKLNKSIEQCYKMFGNELIKKYGSLYAAFEECAYDCDILKKDGFQELWLKEFEKIAKENISIPFVQIKGFLTINSWLPDGINHIRQALLNAEQCDFEDIEITIRSVGAPQYIISIKAPDYKIAEDEMKKAVERAGVYIKEHKGSYEFHRKHGG